MAVVQTKTGSCFGRGFGAEDANGYLKNFYDWVTTAPSATPGAGGPGWYIIDDSSADANNPFIIISDVASPTVNGYNNGAAGGAQKIIKVQAEDARSGDITVFNYMGWSSSTPYGLFKTLYVDTVDAGNFVYDFRGGDEFMSIGSQIAGEYNFAMLDEFLGDTNFTEQSSVIGTLTVAVSGTSTTEVITLSAGEATKFTSGRHYFIYDFTGHSWIRYVKCTNVDVGSEQITIQNQGNAGTNFNPYPIGSVIGARPHRYSLCDETNPYLGYVPFAGTSGFDYSGDYSLSTKGYYCPLTSVITRSDPMLNGKRVVHKPYIRYNLYSRSASANLTTYTEILGPSKNIYVGSSSAMSPGLDGLTINTKEWVYIDNDIFLPNYTSIS